MKNSPLKATGIDHVVLHVKSIARSKRFYGGLLGMKVRFQGPGYVFLRCGRQTVALFTVGKREPIHAGDEMNHMALTLQSGSTKRVKTVLQDAGFKVWGRSGDPDCIYFRDPDGHRLQLLTP